MLEWWWWCGDGDGGGCERGRQHFWHITKVSCKVCVLSTMAYTRRVQIYQQLYNYETRESTLFFHLVFFFYILYNFHYATQKYYNTYIWNKIIIIREKREEEKSTKSKIMYFLYKIIYINARSLLNKTEEIKHTIKQINQINHCSVQLISITETWINNLNIT